MQESALRLLPNYKATGEYCMSREFCRSQNPKVVLEGTRLSQSQARLSKLKSRPMTAYERGKCVTTHRDHQISAEHEDVMSAMEDFKGKEKPSKARNCFARQNLDLLLK